MSDDLDPEVKRVREQIEELLAKDGDENAELTEDEYELLTEKEKDPLYADLFK